MAHPRYGLSIPNRGVLYDVTTVEQILELAAQADPSESLPFVIQERLKADG